MKRVIIIILLVLPFFSIYAQNYNWITPNQTYLKLYIADDGIYRINKVDFTNAGVNTGSIDPRTVKMYYKGIQIPIYFFGEQNGTFDDTDYLDFYGTRNYGGATNTYDANNQVVYVTNEYFDLYSDTSAYWIGWGGVNGLRYADYNTTSTTPYPYDFYYKKLHFERDLYYSLGENTGSLDYGNFSNDKYQGEGWYWQLMLYLNTITQSFNAQYLSTSIQPCRLKIFAYPNNQNTSLTNEHRLLLKFNTSTLDTFKMNHFQKLDTTVSFPSSYLLSGANTATVRYLPPSSNSSGQVNFDMFEISYPRRFDFDSNQVSFSSEIPDSSSKVFKFRGFVSANETNIYDVKNGVKISNFSTSSDTLIISGKGNGKFEIVNKYITKKPIRIKQKQVPNLTAVSNGTDYLIIYNKFFEAPAEQLRQYRNTHDGFRSVKAEIEDIYDIFNYGMENPIAVRNFTKYIYDNWQLPKTRFLCLFGRGSLDPKKNISSSQFYQNFIPVYGNPVTDGYYANFNIGTSTYYHQISVGRLPVYTNQEAQDVVNKIITYENQELPLWIKKSIFITGGYDKNEQQQFIAQSNYFINSYITPRPTSSDPVRIYLNDTSGLVTYNYSDSIKNSINRGSLIMNFITHSGNGYWDYVFEDPAILSNQTQLPLILSMTCFTGKNAEPNNRGYGERYILYPDKGALGFISTTGWSFSNSGNTFNDYLLNGFSLDTLRRIGDILKRASQRMASDSANGGFAVRNTINCYNLLGDPAAKLLLPINPEFAIHSGDYILSNPFPSLRENNTLTIYPQNLGTYADSCKIRYQLIKNNQNYRIKDTVVYSFRFIDTINYSFMIDSAGSYVMKVILDQDNWYPMEIKSNNIISIPITLKNIAFVPLKPIDNQVIASDSIDFVGINPNINPSKYNVKLLLQVDTTKVFNSPILQSYFKTNMTGVVTKFKIRVPILDSNIIYFWRLNTIVNNSDSIGWSKYNRLKFNPGTFNRTTKSDNIFATGDSIIKINKSKPMQFELIDFNKAKADTVGINSEKYVGLIYVRSQTAFGWSPSYITINNINFQFDINLTGLNIIRVTKATGSIINIRNFKVTSIQSSDSIVNYLNGFDSLSNIVVCKNFYTSGGTTLSLSARNKFKEFGCIYVDSVGSFGWYSTWAFLGYLGANSTQCKEQFIYYPGGGSDANPSIIQSNPIFPYINSSVISSFGPAHSWKNFSWEQVLYLNSNIKFDVYGIDRNNNPQLLMPDVTSNNFVDLSGINAYQYPNLKLITKLSIDSINGYQSPVFKSITFNYVPASDLALDNNSTIKSDSIVTMGDSVGFGITYYNVGFTNVNGVVRNFFAYDQNGNKINLKTDTVQTALKIDSSGFIKATLPVSRMPIFKKYNNQVNFNFEVQPLAHQNEIYTYNNTVNSNFYVKGSPLLLNLDVFSDGAKIMSGDYVRLKPDILVKLSKQKSDSLTTLDTSYIRIFVNNKIIILGGDKKNSNGGVITETGKDNLILKFTPELNTGQNEFRFITMNAGKNSYDTAKYAVTVSNELMVKDLFNYPNPMKTETTFTFNIAGSNVPTDCRIKIFSVAGRVVKTIRIPASIGVNQYAWDGRDEEGDYMANGVYFYKIIIEGDNQKETSLQKLAILR